MTSLYDLRRCAICVAVRVVVVHLVQLHPKALAFCADGSIGNLHGADRNPCLRRCVATYVEAPRF